MKDYVYLVQKHSYIKSRKYEASIDFYLLMYVHANCDRICANAMKLSKLREFFL